MSYENPKDLQLKLRNLTIDDLDQLEELMDRVYDDLGGSWPKESLALLLKQFPEGQIVI